MIKNLLILFLMLLLTTSNSFSQAKKKENLFKGIASIGMNACQIDGDGPYGYRYIGATGGIGVMVQFHKNLSASMEMLYTMRGSIVRRNLQINPQQTFTVATDYIEIPLCLNVNDKKLVMASFGLSPSVLVRYNLKYQAYNASGLATNDACPACLSNQPSKFDLSAIVGFQFLIKNQFGIGARFSYSILGIRPPCVGDTRAKSQYHNVLTLKTSYIITGKKKKSK